MHGRIFLHIKFILFGSIFLSLLSCDRSKPDPSEGEAYASVRIAGAMKNVMWKGELGAMISLDTIRERDGLYAVGPLSYLKGEVLLNNGQSYVSRVLADSSMTIEETFNIDAPFLVYANVKEWREIELPSEIKTIADLEKFVDHNTKGSKRPFAFKLSGNVKTADIHIQNLPDGKTVSSPEEAHQGQVKYLLGNEDIEVVGFFSTKHQGIFTHHDSYLHMHLITADKKKMGHLDKVEFGKMRLFLPIK